MVSDPGFRVGVEGTVSMKKEVVTQSHSFSCVLYTCGFAQVNDLLKTPPIETGVLLPNNQR